MLHQNKKQTLEENQLQLVTSWIFALYNRVLSQTVLDILFLSILTAVFLVYHYHEKKTFDICMNISIVLEEMWHNTACKAIRISVFFTCGVATLNVYWTVTSSKVDATNLAKDIWFLLASTFLICPDVFWWVLSGFTPILPSYKGFELHSLHKNVFSPSLPETHFDKLFLFLP